MHGVSLHIGRLRMPRMFTKLWFQAEARAEFAERSVQKLQKEVDRLEGAYRLRWSSLRLQLVIFILLIDFLTVLFARVFINKVVCRRSIGREGKEQAVSGRDGGDVARYSEHVNERSVFDS